MQRQSLQAISRFTLQANSSSHRPHASLNASDASFGACKPCERCACISQTAAHYEAEDWTGCRSLQSMRTMQVAAADGHLALSRETPPSWTHPVVHADISPEREAEAANTRSRLDQRLCSGDAQAFTEYDDRREAVDGDQRSAKVNAGAL